MTIIDGTVTGTIVDEQKQPIPFANVALLANGIQVDVSITNTKGEFVLKPPPGHYDLKAVYVGYRSVERRDVAVGIGKITNIGTITMSANETGDQ